MHKFIAIFSTLALAIGAAFAASEATPEEPVVTAADQELAPGLKPLNFLVGRWKVDQEMVVIPKMADHKDHQMHGTFNVRRGLGGRALIGDYEGQTMLDTPFFGHMVLTAENRAGDRSNPNDVGDYTSYWADSRGITCFSKDVTWKDDKLTISASDWLGDKQGKARAVYTRKDDDHVEMALEAESPDGWVRIMHATYTRTDKAQ